MVPSPQPSRRRRLVFRLVAFTGMLAVALGVLEVGLRLFWTGYYRNEPGMRSQRSATLGWTNRPSVSYRHGEPEFVMEARHDSHGFRGAETPDAKPAGRVRVLALGDSFTYGIGVAEAETFCARLAAAEPRLEVVNTGVEGYGTAQQWLLFRETGARLRPDVVLLCYFWNDLANNMKRIEPLGLRLGADGSVAHTPPPPVAQKPEEARGGGGALHGSYAYRYLRDGWKTLWLRMKSAAGADLEDPDRLLPEQVEEAWRWQEALLAALARDVSASGARFAVVVIPDQVQVHPEIEVAGLRDHFLDVQERLGAIGKKIGVPVIDLLPGIRDAASRTKAPLYHRFDRHLNAAGHAAAAEVLVTEMRRLRLW